MNDKELAKRCYEIDLNGCNIEIESLDRFMKFSSSQMQKTKNLQLKQYLSSVIHDTAEKKMGVLKQKDHILHMIDYMTEEMDLMKVFKCLSCKHGIEVELSTDEQTLYVKCDVRPEIKQVLKQCDKYDKEERK